MPREGPTWYDATAGERPSFPTLAGDRRADVCVIGAGFTGLSAALHLAERGLDVVLLEAGRVGDGGSGRNGGQIHSGQRRETAYLEKVAGRSDAKKLWDMAEDAKHLVRELVDGGPVERGLAFMALNGGAFARELGHQHANRLAQFLRAERLELGLVDHGA